MGRVEGSRRRSSRSNRISRLRWWDGVKGPEIEEILRWGPYLRADGDARYLAYGATGHGRLLLVVLRRAGPGDLRVVAARDMTGRERDAFREHGP